VTERSAPGDSTITVRDAATRGDPLPDVRAGLISERLAAGRVRAAVLGEPEPPPLLDRYRLSSVLGAGAMGQVWRAHDPRLSRDVAIKLIAGHAVSQVLLDRLGREARAMAKLSDPHVVGVFDVGTYDLAAEQRGVFIVMELVEGTTLAQWMTTPRAPTAVIDAFVQAGLGLAAAHDAGLVHRDFKPANVLVGTDGRIRVGDFGLARRGSEDQVAHRDLVVDMIAHELIDTVAGSLTESGIVLGTPLYMAPEQHRGELADARSDQYSFCVALYEALAGARAFSGDMQAIHAAKLARKLQPPAPNRPIPERLLAVVLRGLAPQPSERWPSMRALVAELRASGGRRRGLAQVGAAAVAVIAGAVIFGPSADTRECLELGRIENVWGDVQRRALRSTLTDTGTAESAARAIGAIDANAEALRVELVARCDASAAGACLRDATTQLVTTLEILASDDRAATAALATVHGLSDPRVCADASGAAPPELAAMRDATATALALSNAGQLDRAVATAVGAREQARTLGPIAAPLAARLSYRIAAMRDDLGLDSLAATDFEDAHFVAMNLDDDALAASAAIRLALLFTQAADYGDADRWRRHARATSARASFGSCDGLEYGMYEASIDGLRDDLDAGLQRLTEVVAQCSPDTCERLCIIAKNNLAELLEESARPGEALPLRRDVLAGQGDLHGAESNQVALARLGLAETLLATGDPTEALAILEPTIPKIESLLGRGHPSLARGMVLQAQARSNTGDPTGAVAAAREALELGEQFFDGNTRRRDSIRGTLANALGDVGDFEGALRLYDLILADPTAASSSRVVSQIGRGYTRMQSGDIDGAVADAVEARAGLPERLVEMIELTFANEAEAYLTARRCADSDRVLTDGIAWARRAGLDDARLRLTQSRASLAAGCLP